MDKGRLEAFSDGVIAIILEIAALVFAFIGSLRFISYILLLAMTLLWIVPDIRMEQIFEETNRGNE